MDIIQNKNTKIKYKGEINTILKVNFKNDISEDLGEVIPYPHKHFIDMTNIIYYFYIDGFFGTKKSIDFINDIIARFLITYKDNIKDIKHYNTTEEKPHYYKLKDFQNLSSKVVSIINQTNRFDNSQDFIFWCLKLYAEEVIQERGLITYDTLFDFGYLNFGQSTNIKSCKDLSTLKSKCRSIVNYYINRDYQLDRYEKKYNTDEEKELLKMTRKENMIKMNKKVEEKNLQIVRTFMNSMFINDYKKPNGSWNIKKISEDLKMSRPTIRKHLKELEIY